MYVRLRMKDNDNTTTIVTIVNDRDACKYLLRLSLVGALTLMIDATEIGHDDRDRQSDDEHAAQ